MRGIDPGRRLIEQTFGFDPSTPRDDVTGSIPQALFLMNSPQMEGVIRVRSPRGPLGDILDSSETDGDVVRQMYLRVLGRDATDQEQNICVTSISQGQHRDFAYEDVYWALINSSEFLTKR